MTSRCLTPAYPPGLRAVEGRNRRLRQLLAGPGILVAPGCFDCLTGKLVEKAGFDAAYITGSGVSISQLGAPDLGLASFSEILDRMKRIADAVTVPLVADIDTGFGGPLNVLRTVREFEKAGISGVQIEDQVAPKRCGHEPGRRVVPIAEMQARIRAAVDARLDQDFVVIARTDARTIHGIDAAIERAARYAEAGADVLFVESPESEAEMRRITSALKGVAPLMANMVEGGKTPILPAAKLEEIGYRLAIFPNSLTRAFAAAGREIMAELRRTGTTTGLKDRMVTHRELWSLFDYDTWIELEAGFSKADGATRKAAE